MFEPKFNTNTVSLSAYCKAPARPLRQANHALAMAILKGRGWVSDKTLKILSKISKLSTNFSLFK